MMLRKLAFVAVVMMATMVGVSAQAPAPAGAARVTVKNPLDLARTAETVVLTAEVIKKSLPVDDIRKVYVRDDASGADVLAQPVDVDDNGSFDELVFQTDIGAGQTKTFTLTAGERRVFTREQFKAYGRFNRERRDDFAWENDLVAHRMYGAALETWAQEPLTSSTMDVWIKRTRRLVINDWYMVDDYHRDLGEGADLYSAGKSRGCGGNGPWENGKLWPSANFRNTRLLAQGPIRVMFELMYVDWDVNGRQVHETKRITLDAGQNLSRIESQYASAGARPSQHAAGIKKQPGALARADKAAGILRTWEAAGKSAAAGHFGCAVVMAPNVVVDTPDVPGDNLMVATVPASGPAVYYAGAGWDKGGNMADAAAWDAYLDQFGRKLGAPLLVSVSVK
jgi:unsaturated rhamnogalacturonyl hydrolase